MKSNLIGHLNRIIANLRDPGAWIRNATDNGLAFETDSPDRAGARCSDLLGRPEIARVEVRIGRAHAKSTNPEAFRRQIDSIARAFVREGQPVFALSIDWASVLDDQNLIYVQAFPHEAGAVDASGRSLTPKEQAAVKQEIVTEFAYAVKREQAKSPAPLCLSGLTLVCFDRDYDPWLSGIAADVQGFTKAFLNTMRELKWVASPGFRARYRFESDPARTVPLGKGALQFELQVGSIADAGGTVVIGQNSASPVAMVRWLGLGTERIDNEPTLVLPLPGSVNRSLLARTSLARQDRANLQVVSEDRHALKVGIENGCLALSAEARHNDAGGTVPSHFLVQNGEEVPLIGKRRIKGNRAEVLIGSESFRTGRSPDGSHVLRPVRIEVLLQHPAR